MATETSHRKITKEAIHGRKVFKEMGTCSRTFFTILNEEFDHPKELEGRAADPLAGGIMQKGHQCGMLWGASLAVGAEAYRRSKDLDQAIALAIFATQKIMASFKKKEHTILCREITRCDFSNKWSFVKYMLSGRFLHCFRLAEEWAPEAVEAAIEALENTDVRSFPGTRSCASELAKKMGANEEQMVMVAGFAGGLGLSGKVCGALSAAIWLNTLEWAREVDSKNRMKNPKASAALASFESMMQDKIMCTEISGQKFDSPKSHSEFIKNGGCKDVIDLLAATRV